jgi:hypothetical protein
MTRYQFEVETDTGDRRMIGVDRPTASDRYVWTDRMGLHEKLDDAVQPLRSALINDVLVGNARSVSVPEAACIQDGVAKQISGDGCRRIGLGDPHDPRLIPVARDIADHYDAEYVGPPLTREPTAAVVLRLVRGTVLTTLGLMYWLVWRVFNEVPPLGEYVFLYGPGRWGNKSPILQAAEEREPEASFIHIGLRPTRGLPDAVHQYDPRALGTYTTVVACVRFYILIWRVINQLWNRDDSKPLYEAQISHDAVKLNHTAGVLVWRGFRNLDYTALAKYSVSLAMLERHEPQAVIIGSLSAVNQLFWLSADAHGIPTYHTPHSILNTKLWNPNMHHLVSGHSEISFLERIDVDTTMYQASGRPYLTDLADRCLSDGPHISTSSRSERILICTSPSSSAEEIDTLIRAVAGASDAIDLAIKVHPMEQERKYDRSAARGVDVVSDRLHEQILASDVIIAGASNTLIEAMVLGKFAVSYRPPVIWPVMEHEEVPVTDSVREVISLVHGDWSGLAKQQHRFIAEQYILTGNAEDNMLDWIYS